GVLFGFVAIGTCLAGTPLGTAFTYQGKLNQSGSPLTGTANLVFSLYDASSGGTVLGSQTQNGVSVTGGLFTVSLDFGVNAYVDNQARWLEIAVNGTTLSPRQALTPTPFSLNTRGLQ